MPPVNYGTVVIIGAAGTGKRSLFNAIFSEEIDPKVTPCKPREYSGNWKAGYSEIRIIKLPGFDDENWTFIELLEFYRTNLQGRKVNAILFVVKATDHRFNIYASATLAIIRACVQIQNPENLWDNVVFVGTHADKINVRKEGPVATRLESLRKAANQSLKTKQGGIWRQVGISLDEDSRELHTAGFEELDRHLRALRGSQIEMKKKFPDNSELVKIHNEMTGSKCFDGNMIVRVLKEGKVEESKLTEVKLFDKIQVNDGSFEPVIVLSRHINEASLTLSFQAEDEKSERKLNLCLVPYHFMLVMREKQMVHIPARKVTINDKLLCLSEDGTVTSMDIINITNKVSKDTVNVRTQSRTVIVNDFCCSSVVEGDTGTLGHYFSLACGKIHQELPNEVNKLGLWLKSAYSGIKNLEASQIYNF